MSLRRALGELSHRTQFVRRNLVLLSATAVAGMVLTAVVGIAGTVVTSRALNEANVAAGALRTHAEVDRTDDALLGDMFRAARGNPAARQDFEKHAQYLLELLSELERTPLSDRLDEELAQEARALRGILKGERELLARLPLPLAEVDDFAARARRMQPQQSAVSDQLRELVARAQARGRESQRTGVVLMLLAFLAILLGVGFTAVRLARAVLGANRQLQDVLERAVQADSSRGEFLANMSHEIRTPMTGVLGMIDLLAAEDLSPQQRKYVHAMRSSGQHLLAVINDILDYTRIETGRLQLEEVDFSLPQVLEQLRSLVHPLAVEHGLALAIELAPHSPPVLTGDPTRLLQVLLNLCTNAVKFTQRGVVRVHITPVRHDQGVWRFRFEVIDTGVGIAPEALAQLFSAFRQADASITRRFGGSGLGLAICKRLVEGMGGEIGVQSTPGVGSVFHFEVDLAIGDPARLPASPLEQASQVEPKRILVAEDVEINREILRQGLGRAGHELVFAVDGAQAVELAQREEFDLVLMDVQMPVMDGIEATRRIRKLGNGNSRIPILALTANVMAQERERYIAAGMDECLMKPIDWEQLFHAIGRHAAESNAAPPAGAAPTPAPADEGPALVDDAAHARLVGMASREHLLEWLELALSGYDAGCAQIAEAGDDAKAVAAQAHKIKGSAGTLGLPRLQVRAEELESSANGGEVQQPQVERLQQALADTREALHERGLL